MRPRLKIGDLVKLTLDEYLSYGFGIIVDKHSHGDWEVFWLDYARIEIETTRNIEVACLPEDD